MKMENLKKKYVLAVLVSFILFVCFIAHAEDNSITNLTTEQQKKESEIQDKIKALEEKAKTYQQIIEIKKKQQATLSNQISIIETESDRLEAEISLNKEKINSLNIQVGELRDQIAGKEISIKDQKRILSELIQIYCEYHQQDTLSFVFSNEGLANFMAEEDRLSQTGDKITEMIKNVKSLKDSLENEKKAIEEKKKEATDLSFELEEKSSQLESIKDQKQSLVAQTKGEENRYQDLLARVEKQKQELLGDIDELYSVNTAEINKLAGSLPKPTSGLASTSWYYSQKDGRWGNSRIGQSKSLIKDYGCALTSVAMIFTYYGETTTPKNLAQQKIYYWDLIVWPNGKNIELVKNTNHGGINWKEIDRELANGNPVIVFIKAKSSAGHYVVIHHKASNGKYVVHDPYWGPNIYLDSSIKLLSALYKTSISKNSVDQMVLYRK